MSPALKRTSALGPRSAAPRSRLGALGLGLLVLLGGCATPGQHVFQQEGGALSPGVPPRTAPPPAPQLPRGAPPVGPRAPLRLPPVPGTPLKVPAPALPIPWLLPRAILPLSALFTLLAPGEAQAPGVDISCLSRSWHQDFRLAGTTHPSAGVPYDDNGEPVFKPLVIVPLSEPLPPSAKGLLEAARAAAHALHEQLKASPERRAHFTSEQLTALEEERLSPPGLSWHLAGDRASMQLVDASTHDLTSRPSPWALSQAAELAELPTDSLLAEEQRFDELAEEAESARRHPAQLEQLLPLRPRLHQPPPGVSPDEPHWQRYVAYWERRYQEMLDDSREGLPLHKPPVYYEFYEPLRRLFHNASVYEQGRAEALRQQTLLPAKERLYFTSMEHPRLEIHLGVRPRGAKKTFFVDQLTWDLSGGLNPLVEVFSNKQRDFRLKTEKESVAQTERDSREAVKKYGGTIEVRRRGHPFFGRMLNVSKVHLIYDIILVPKDFRTSMKEAAEDLGVEVHFE